MFLCFALGAIVLFSSCSEEVTNPVVSVSEDGQMTITIVGKRYNSFDPYMLTITAVLDGEEYPAKVEAQIDALTDDIVKFDWKGNRNCNIYITQRDGVVIPVPVGIFK